MASLYALTSETRRFKCGGRLGAERGLDRQEHHVGPITARVRIGILLLESGRQSFIQVLGSGSYLYTDDIRK